MQRDNIATCATLVSIVMTLVGSVTFSVTIIVTSFIVYTCALFAKIYFRMGVELHRHP